MRYGIQIGRIGAVGEWHPLLDKVESERQRGHARRLNSLPRLDGNRENAGPVLLLFLTMTGSEKKGRFVQKFACSASSRGANGQARSNVPTIPASAKMCSLAFNSWTAAFLRLARQCLADPLDLILIGERARNCYRANLSRHLAARRLRQWKSFCSRPGRLHGSLERNG
ncbi:hypothetical protein X743_17755 [Mesorhizobium sp. LNHC252B00]|nr:hypothetical protein X743_17755 [Mesorhizobium sp. LNHC252B00]